MAQAMDWLGPFIENEVRSVILWKQAIDGTSIVKPESFERFSDDGSNFRSVIDSSTLPPDPRIQISKIVSIEDRVTLFVTDGFTRLRATLSENAVLELRAGLGEAIELDMSGDVLSLREATVEITPYGPTDGYIQLAIEQLEYLFHLRKPLGQPKPIQERAETCRLIKEIEDLRLNQYQTFEAHRDIPPHSSPISGRSAPPAQDETPKSQRSVAISQHSSPVFTQSPTTQRQLATQIPTRHRSNGPTLARDGFAMEEGVNLSRPVEPESRGVSRDIPSVNMIPPTNQTGAKLLGLLGKRKAEAPAEPARPAQIPAVAQDPASPVAIAQQAPTVVEPAAEEVPAVHSPPPTSHQIPPAQRKARDYRRRKISSDQRKLLDKDSSWLPSLPGKTFPHPNVPIELLKRWNAQSTSPVKALAGTESTRADVAPIADVQELTPVKAIECAFGSSPGKESSVEENYPWSPSQRSPAKPLLPPDSSPPRNSRPSTSEGRTGPQINTRGLISQNSDLPPGNSVSSNSRPSTSEGRTASAVTASKTPEIKHRGLTNRNSDLSPHSSVSSNSRPSTSEGRQAGTTIASRIPTSELSKLPNRNWDLPPHRRVLSDSRPPPPPGRNVPANGTFRSPERRVSRPQRRNSNLSPDSSAVSRRPSTPPAKPHRNPQIGSRPSPRTLAARGPQPMSARDGSRSSSSYDGERGRPSTALDTAFMKPSPRAFKRPRESPTSTLATVVRGTQFSRNDDEEMEMAVPRSLEQDPAVAHRQRRSEHFKALQRREWVKANFTSNAAAKAQFSRTYSAYKKAHPIDAVKLTEFAEAIEDVYPAEAEDDAPVEVASTSVPAKDVPSTFSKIVPAPIADADGAVDTPQVSVRRVTTTNSTPRSTSSSGRVLPWASGGNSAPGSGIAESRNGKAPASSFFAEFKRPASLPSPQLASARGSTPKASSLTRPTATQVKNVHVLETPRPPSTNKTIHRAAASNSNSGTTTHVAPTRPSLPPPTSKAPLTQIGDHPDRPRKKIVQDERNETPPATPLAEFAHAWKNLRPGGAFAQGEEGVRDGKREGKSDGRGKGRRPLGARIDVLGWEL